MHRGPVDPHASKFRVCLCISRWKASHFTVRGLKVKKSTFEGTEMYIKSQK